MFHEIVRGADELNRRVYELERELKRSNANNASAEQRFANVLHENLKLQSAVKAGADSKSVRDQAEAWMAVCDALGGLRGRGNTGKDIAVNMIRELQRTAALYDAIRTSLDSLR